MNMLHRAAADRLVGDEIAPGYVRPAYDGRSFWNVPATVGSVLGVDIGGTPLASEVFTCETSAIETVVVVVVDGFGFEQYARHHADHEFFARLTDRTDVWPLTSVFPSETAAAMGTYMTGRPPVEHGLIGWNIPMKNTVIESLPFETKAGDNAGDALGIEREMLREGPSIAQQFHEAGVSTRQIIPEAVVTGDAGLSSVTQLPYEDLDGFSDQLRAAITRTNGFVHAYLPHVDGAAHEVGTSGAKYRETLDSVSTALTRAIGKLSATTTERTLLVVTADHGHVDTAPEKNVDLLQRDRIADVIETDAHGTPLLGGGGRNVHFYAEDATPEQIQKTLTEEFEEQALVLTREQALTERLFGPGEPSDTFERQCGDVLLIPDERTMWYENEADELEFIGFHGGLHPDELLVPFAAVAVSDLQERA